MAELFIEAESLSKRFDHRTIFADLKFTLQSQQGLGIVGRNGSGKTTLAKIIGGILSPTSGRVHYTLASKPIAPILLPEHVGYVAPYLQLYDEFTGLENLDLACRIRGVKAADGLLKALLERVNLGERKDNPVRTYSSGMKQRLKYAFALVHKPPLLILDEPTSNLDADGVQIVNQIMREQVEQGALVVATNEPEDLTYCTQKLDLNVFADSFQPTRSGA